MADILLLLFPFRKHLPLCHLMEPSSLLSSCCLLVPRAGALLTCFGEAAPGPLYPEVLAHPLAQGPLPHCLPGPSASLGSLLAAETRWIYTRWSLGGLIFSLVLILAYRQRARSGQPHRLSISTPGARVVGTRGAPGPSQLQERAVCAIAPLLRQSESPQTAPGMQLLALPWAEISPSNLLPSWDGQIFLRGLWDPISNQLPWEMEVFLLGGGWRGECQRGMSALVFPGHWADTVNGGLLSWDLDCPESVLQSCLEYRSPAN